MKSIFVIIIICFCFISCNHIKKKEELLAGKEYKYWAIVPNNRVDSVYNQIIYYDREGKTLIYSYNIIKDTFYMPKFYDVLYAPYWYLIDDKTLNEGGVHYRIIKLTEKDLVILFRGKEVHYRAAPMEIIPKEYQCVQPLPKALGGK